MSKGSISKKEKIRRLKKGIRKKRKKNNREIVKMNFLVHTLHLILLVDLKQGV